MLAVTALLTACAQDGGLKLEAEVETLYFTQTAPLRMEPHEAITVLPRSELPEMSNVDDCVIEAIRESDPALKVIPAASLPNTFSFDGTLGLYDVEALIGRPKAKAEVARANLRHIAAVGYSMPDNDEDFSLLRCMTISCKTVGQLTAKVWDIKQRAWTAEITVVARGRFWAAPTIFIFVPLGADSDVYGEACAELGHKLGAELSPRTQLDAN